MSVSRRSSRSTRSSSSATTKGFCDDAHDPCLLIVGPPGSGKGTQAVRIAEAFGIPAISTGDVFRANIKAGHRARQAGQGDHRRGRLVPDELTSALVRDRLAQADAADGFLLDGYPRNLAQVDDLDDVPRARRARSSTPSSS